MFTRVNLVSLYNTGDELSAAEQSMEESGGAAAGEAEADVALALAGWPRCCDCVTAILPSAARPT